MTRIIMMMATRAKRTKKAGSWGGDRPGSGRPTLYSGARAVVSFKLTKTAREAIAAQLDDMRQAHGTKASSSAAVEFLVRKGRGLPTDPE